jgi:hypothetical protein
MPKNDGKTIDMLPRTGIEKSVTVEELLKLRLVDTNDGTIGAVTATSLRGKPRPPGAN